MDRSNEHPIVSADGPSILYCARCGMATTRIDALQRRFNTGYSGCCNDNLVDTPRKNRLEPLPDHGASAFPTSAEPK